MFLSLDAVSLFTNVENFDIILKRNDTGKIVTTTITKRSL